MRSLLRMCLGLRADEALADMRELRERRAAKGNRPFASARYGVDITSLVLVGVRERIFSGIVADVQRKEGPAPLVSPENCRHLLAERRTR